MDINEIRKRQDELKKKINEIKETREKEFQEYTKRLEQHFEKRNKYLAMVKIIDYSSVRRFVDCDEVVHTLKEGKILILPLPNALPLVRAGIGTILTIFPRGKQIPKVKLCPFCKSSTKTVKLFETTVDSDTVILHEVCPFCGKSLKTKTYKTSCSSKK